MPITYYSKQEVRALLENYSSRVHAAMFDRQMEENKSKHPQRGQRASAVFAAAVMLDDLSDSIIRSLVE